MSNQDSSLRFEELEAGRILGDLDAGETKEWQQLSEELNLGPDLSLELLAAAIETEFVNQEEDHLPDHLAEGLRRQMSGFIAPEAADEKIIHPPAWSSPRMAWAIAALFAVLFVANFLSRGTDRGTDRGSNPPLVMVPATPSPLEARDKLLAEATDLIKSDFGGIESYTTMSGRVVWSDALQEGYMTLSNLPANNPNQNQYQLWIVDPQRDQKPVDGGVFDIPAGQTTAVIPIRNPLAVAQPQAFVITLEQPGGVVVSEQKVVVALAKTT